MKKIILLFFLAVSCLTGNAQNEILAQDRMNLQNLLAERAKKFSSYTTSIQKRSGIFGNKTKGDIQKSNEVLLAIVTLDNEIMDALKRALSYKTFEKATDNYSNRDCEMKLKQSMQVTDTLMKQLAVVEKEIRQRDSSASVYKVLFWLMAIGGIAIFINMKRKRHT
jgi:hypothetical protein